MKTILTENQKKAHDFSRHISVTANAGSGKTMVLANRFLNILLNTDTSVEELVAITFTEKAAGELKKRIADSVDDIINSTTDIKLKSKCQNIRSHLSSANISTIHSFCAKILRLYPVEANVDVAFTILEGVDKKILIDEIINETFSDILKNSDDSLRQELVTLLRTLRKKNLVQLLNYLIEKREQVERLISDNGLYIKSDEDILNYWKDNIVEFLISEINPQYLLTLIQPINLPDLSFKQEFISKIQSITNTQNSDERYKLLQQLQVLFDTITNLKTKKSDAEHTQITELKKYCKDTNQTLRKFIVLEKNMQILNFSRTIIKIYKSIIETYEKEKFNKSYLDYEDLQLKIRQLLKSPEVQRNLSNRYKYIMIDEYQDTNYLQYEIFLPLLNDLKKGNLFIVGDPKQSIFGFRNAEVEVFEKTRSDIVNNTDNQNDLSFNGEFLTSSEKEKKGEIILAENFRLLTDIIAFVNLVFKKLLGTVKHEFDVNYQELIKGRNNPENGRVELMLNFLNETVENQEEEDSLASISNAEFEMIARRIIKLKQDSYPIFEADPSKNFEEKVRNFEYSDAAILLRSRTYLKKLEYWLNKYNIPYIISGGIGFYQTQEIYDFYNYFQFLLNNQDEAALVGILRSPFFGISDSELYEIALVNEDSDFWSKVQKYASGEKSSVYLKRAVNILNENISYAGRVPIPILVQTIFKQTGWIGSIAGIQRGEQSKLNVNKLLNIARDFEGRGFTNLFDFVERLKTLIEKEEREGQANILKDSNAVQIMTIHSAKGLEFPVVFLPFLHKQFKPDNGPFVDSKFGIGFKIENTDEEGNEFPIFNFIKYRFKMKTLAEEKRLLYVACTRARDLLILSGTVKQNFKRYSLNYLNLIIDALGINQFNQKELVYPNQKIKSIVLRDGKFIPFEFEHDLKIPVITSLEELNISSKFQIKPNTVLPIKKIFIQNIPAHLKNNFYSATQIQTYFTCPMKYYLKFQLGIPESENALFTFNEEYEPDDKIYSEQIGLGVHKILEKFQYYSENEIINFLQNFLPLELYKSPEELEQTIKIIISHVKNYYNSDIFKEISSYNEFKNEYTINSQFGENFITGTMDKIVKDKNNNWLIIDYKTDRTNGMSIEQKAKKYFYQMGFYALLINRMFRQNQVEVFIIFTDKEKDNYYKFKFTSEELKTIEASIQEAVHKISTGDFKLNPEMCDFCRYQKNGNCIGEKISILR